MKDEDVKEESVYLNDVKMTSEEMQRVASDPSVRLHEESPGHFRKLQRMTE